MITLPLKEVAAVARLDQSDHVTISLLNPVHLEIRQLGANEGPGRWGRRFCAFKYPGKDKGKPLNVTLR